MERHPAKQSQHDHEKLEQATEAAIRQQRRRERALMGVWVGGTLVALVATVALLESCGNSRTSASRRVSYEQQEATAPQAVVASTGPISAGTNPGVSEVNTVGGDPNGLTVPPDVVASVSDSFVTPGQPIEVSVEGTPDITEMALSDGRGDAIPMVRDASGLVWKVNYRVPLRPRTDRLGLAVTATNDTHRWRRVWVFLQVDDGKQHLEATEKPAVEGDSLR
jgi:hypothetical protein